MKVKILLLTLLLALAIKAQAGPTNPVPTVTLAWDANSGTNNYRVYYGVSSRVYTNSISAGGNLTLTITNLTRGATYYFAVTASTFGLESDFSTEVNCTFNSVPPIPLNFRLISTGP